MVACFARPRARRVRIPTSRPQPTVREQGKRRYPLYLWSSMKSHVTAQNKALDATTTAKSVQAAPWQKPSWQQPQQAQGVVVPPPPPPPRQPLPTSSPTLNNVNPIPPPPPPYRQWQDLGKQRGGKGSDARSREKRKHDPIVQEKAAKWAKSRADDAARAVQNRELAVATEDAQAPVGSTVNPYM